LRYYESENLYAEVSEGWCSDIDTSVRWFADGVLVFVEEHKYCYRWGWEHKLIATTTRTRKLVMHLLFDLAEKLVKRDSITAETVREIVEELRQMRI